MKRRLLSWFGVALLAVPAARLEAQDPITLIIQQGITKVIKAVDLKVQRLQTKTIWLQNAQKVVENEMSKLKLDEITGWLEKQRVLYRDYFEELQKVKAVLTYYHKVKEIAQLQEALVKEYKRAILGVKGDPRFTAEEVRYMGNVYSGIIDESLQNLDVLHLALNSFVTQMSDEKRMQIIDGVQKQIQRNYDDLRRFSAQNRELSLSRARDEREILEIKHWYGIQ